MSNSQEQSLNENVIFSPLAPSNPDFQHSEVERYCLESLVSSGPEAFYSQLNTEQIVPFLTPGEVNEISRWTENYQEGDVALEDGDGEEQVGSEVDDLSGHYFPEQSDTSAPCLELGWPERNSWMDMGRVNVYTNPTTEGRPSIREVLRRLLQGAKKLIAVVTERLSDCAVIVDLQYAASRGVPVYIILNRRSVEENCFQQQLQHANIRVRVLGGKRFLSRDTKMVVGEMKDNFVLVDLETVMLGSYSLTWTDAHLHRQIVTVMSGPVVESFDQEFRILYAASLPIPDTCKTEKPAHEPQSNCKPEPLNLSSAKIELAEFVESPPPPPTDFFLDWEAMGVIHRFRESPGYLPDVGEPQFFHRPLIMDRHPGIWEVPYNEFTPKVLPGHHEESKLGSMFLSDFRQPEYQRSRRLFSPGDYQVPHGIEPVNRSMQIPERLAYIRPSPSMTIESEERFPLYKPRTHRSDLGSEEDIGPSVRREPFLWRDRVLGDAMNPDGTKQPNIKKSSEVSRSKTFSTLNDIFKWRNTLGTTRQQKTDGGPASGFSKSTLDLHHTDNSANPRTANCENLPLTPALALMKKRNDEVKSGLLRSMPNVFTPTFRSSAHGLQRESWRSSYKSHRNEEEH
ncbi:Protein FAM83E [Triplophysa tibetana]|uniref:Protein FAM83E n=1 Tax=Triplophysa tibetana TaxID=1572043 RepID=A0A5A9NBV7_9TELE|nr:Protein FAM83E [Triplophysa tibetana]